ncbi:hypothetical protein D043_4288B, partial [Vibrio parahaemolyticus EKP-021]
TQYDGFAH